MTVVWPYSYGQRNKKNKTVNLLSLHPIWCYNPFSSIYALTASTLNEYFTANIAFNGFYIYVCYLRYTSNIHISLNCSPQCSHARYFKWFYLLCFFNHPLLDGFTLHISHWNWSLTFLDTQCFPIFQIPLLKLNVIKGLTTTKTNYITSWWWFT